MEIVEPLMIGSYKIIQDPEKYCFTSDSVLLARFLKAKKGERVADFCSGSGIVGLHFFAENPKVESVTLFERQEDLARMSQKMIRINKLEDKFRVENASIQQISIQYMEFFSLILCNPPYERSGFEKADVHQAICRKELTLTLEELCAAARRCLKFGGRFALIHRADRVAEVICALKGHMLEPKKLQFISGKADKPPYAVLISAVKGGKPGVEVLPAAVNQT